MGVNRPAISPDEARVKVDAFNAWLAKQQPEVKDTVEAHMLALKDVMPSYFGPDSAKVLLAEIYLVVRRDMHIERKYGVRS